MFQYICLELYRANPIAKMETPFKPTTLPKPDAPKKKRPRFDSEVDMFHLVASMFADDVPVTTPTKRPTMPEPNAPKRLCVKAVRRVGENPPPFNPDNFFVFT